MVSLTCSPAGVSYVPYCNRRCMKQLHSVIIWCSFFISCNCSENGIAHATAKVHYGTSLSTVDWLHGGAESLLTLTNLFIVFGLRNALQNSAKAEDDDAAAQEEEEGVPLSK